MRPSLIEAEILMEQTNTFPLKDRDTLFLLVKLRSAPLTTINMIIFSYQFRIPQTMFRPLSLGVSFTKLDANIVLLYGIIDALSR